MKTATKIILIVAACLVLAGIAVTVAVLASNSWTLPSFGGSELITRNCDIPEEFQNITIHAETEDIQLLRSDDGSCRVVFCEYEDQRHTAVVESGTLTIRTESEGKWNAHLSLLSQEGPGIKLYLPSDAYAALQIDAGTGEITIPGDFRFDSVDVAASTGSVHCGASVSGQMAIALSTGDMQLEDLSAGDLLLAVSTGRVDLRSVNCTGNVNVSVTTGKATLSGIRCRNLSSSGTTGTISLQDVIAGEKITLERSTGDVNLLACDAAELSIKTDTGDVTGTLSSDKVFFATSDTGKVVVPKTTTGGVCEITTDTGDIHIDIH